MRSTSNTGIVTGSLTIVAAGLLSFVGFYASSLTIAVIAATAGVSLAAVSRDSLILVYGFVLGAVPFAAAQFRGFAVPVIAVASLVITIQILALSRSRDRGQAGNGNRARRGAVHGWFLAYAILSSISFLATRGLYAADPNEFFKWASVTISFFAFSHLPRERMAVAVKAFLFGTGVACLFALSTLVSPSLLQHLGVLGYVRTSEDQRFFVLHGASQGVRLAGSWVDPNIAGVFIFCALVLAASVGLGRAKVPYMALLAVCLLLTLSRGAIAGVVATLICFALVNNAPLGRRLLTAVALIVGAALALRLPFLSDRLGTTFGAQDVGSRDRLSSLFSFTDTMAGNWVYGLGWGRPEYREASAAYRANVVANAPLAAVYRGGLLAGVTFLGFLLALLIHATIQLRTGKGAKLASAGLVGFVVVIQTGYAAVLIPQEAALVAFFVPACIVLSGGWKEAEEAEDTESVGELTNARDS